MSEEHDELLEEFEKKATGARHVDVPLAVATKFDGVERDSLRLRRPTAGDLIEMRETVKSGNQAEETLWLVARCSGTNPKDLRQCDLADLDVCEAVLVGFRGARVARSA